MGYTAVGALDLGNILVVHYVAIALEILRLILAGHLYKRICYLQYMVSFSGPKPALYHNSESGNSISKFCIDLHVFNK